MCDQTHSCAASSCVPTMHPRGSCIKTHPYVRHSAFIFTAWLMHVCDMTHSRCACNASALTLHQNAPHLVDLSLRSSRYSSSPSSRASHAPCPLRHTPRTTRAPPVYLYIYIYVCVYIYMCVYVYIYMCVCVNMYMYIYIYMCVCVNMYICMIYMYLLHHIYIHIHIYI